MNKKVKIFFILTTLIFCIELSYSQGFQTTFGKSKVQYKKFEWTFYRDKNFEVYYYGDGKLLAQYTLINAHKYLEDIEKILDYRIDNRVIIIVYNTFSDFKQSNITLADESSNTGGITPIADNVAFVYFDGNHQHFDSRIKSSITEVLLNELMFGTTIKERIQNSALLNLPDWYYKGFVSYVSGDWDNFRQEKLDDGILSGHFKKFGRLTSPERILIGYSIWEYIDKVYGSKTLQNLLYLTHLDKNIESGFNYAFGKSFSQVYTEWFKFNNFVLKSNNNNYDELPPSIHLPGKSLKGVVTSVRINPAGNKLAYVTNKQGKYRIWIYDISKKKLHKIYKRGYRKIDTDIDYTYPLIAWHPRKDILTVIFEKRAVPRFFDYNLEKRKKENKKKLDRVDEVLDFSYDNQGRNIVMSAVRGGKSDILIFEVRSNRYFPITNDIFDDLNPRFVNNSKGILFSSNRTNDTLSKSMNNAGYTLNNNFDIYYYDYQNNNNILKRITNTQFANESHPEAWDSNWFSYLTDENKVTSRNIVKLDSVFKYIRVTVNYKDTAKFKQDIYYFKNPVISLVKINRAGLKDTAIAGIDTSVVYSDTVYNYRITNYQRNIISYNIPESRKKMVELFRKNDKYYFSVTQRPSDTSNIIHSRSFAEPMEKKYKSLQINLNLEEEAEESIKDTSNLLGINKLLAKVSTKDTFKYLFLNEFQFKVADTSKNNKSNLAYLNKSDIINPPEGEKAAENKFHFGTPSPYFISFTPDHLVSQFDNNSVNTPYLPYDPNQPIQPMYNAINLTLKLGINDLFRDYRLSGGMSIASNLAGAEYLVSFENLKRRLDKIITFYRNGNTYDEGNYKIRELTYELRARFKYPFDEYNTINADIFAMEDKKITLSSELPALQTPDVTNDWLGYKLEFVHDNTLPLGMNLYQGSRYKFYFESYMDPTNNNQNVNILGTDIRGYIKIHRQIIWANRFAAATSFGNAKVVYYLGGVDNWIAPKYNSFIQVDQDINYVFESLAANLRGFDQNIRNGNSYALINSEIRVPIIRYLVNRPLKSSFLENFQIVGFTDIGSAWTGPDPYSENNGLNKREINNPPFFITVTNIGEPIVYGFGAGIRLYLLGYFLKIDHAWGVESNKVVSTVTYLSLGLDF